MKSFTTQTKVRFGDVDPAGIMYYPRIYDMIHESFEELWDIHVGKRYYHLMSEDHLGFPLVRAEVDFKRPLHFGDRPLVQVTCFRLGSASLGLRYVFRVDEHVCVDAQMTVVCVKLDDLGSTPIPDSYRTRFEEIREVS